MNVKTEHWTSLPRYNTTWFSQVLESPGIWKVSWKVLGFVNFYEKSWRSPGILHNICPMNFLFQVVYNKFLPSCYATYSTSLFLVYLSVSRIKILEMLQFLRKYLNILLFSWRDGLKMNASDIGLGKKWHLQYAIIALKMSVLTIWKRLL